MNNVDLNDVQMETWDYSDSYTKIGVNPISDNYLIERSLTFYNDKLKGTDLQYYYIVRDKDVGKTILLSPSKVGVLQEGDIVFCPRSKSKAGPCLLSKEVVHTV